MPIAVDGKVYKNSYDLEMGRPVPQEAPGSTQSQGGTPVPLAENNASAGQNPGERPLPNIEDVPHHDWVEDVAKGIAKSLYSGFTLPGDTLKGKASDEDVGRMLDLSFLALMTPAARNLKGELSPAASDLKNSITEYENFVKTKKLEANPELAPTSFKSAGSSNIEQDISDLLAKELKEKQTYTKPESFEQVPFGYSEAQWANYTSKEKKYILDNPPDFKSEIKELNKPAYDLDKNPIYFTKKEWAGYSDEVKKDILDNIPAGTDPYKYPTVKKPSSETGVYDKYIDMYVKQPSLKTAESLPKDISPVEAFIRGVEEAQAQFKTSLSSIKSNYKKSFTDFPDEVPLPNVSPTGEYTQPAYRGMTVYGKDTTPSAIHDFKRAPEMYSTESPMLADMYAGYLDAHPGIKVPSGAFKEGSQVAPLMINTKDYFYYDAVGKKWTEANTKAINEARKAGKKGVIVDNVWDEPNSTKSLRSPRKIFITFPEGASTVKSRFAKDFNPNSPNMLHSIAAVGVGGTAGFVAMESKDE